MSRIVSRAPKQSQYRSAGTAGSACGGSTPIIPIQEATRPTVAAVNQDFYDGLWSGSHVVLPHRFNTWPLLSTLAASAPARIEIGPGLRPRLPILGTSFVDISRPALSGLKACGGHAMLSEITTLPFPDCCFDLVCAFDIVEHIEDDRQAFRELSRVAKDDATVIFSVPLHPDRWTGFDALVGHVRRYDPDGLLAILGEHALALEQSAVFGMQPRNGWLLDFAVWGMTHKRAQAMRWYNGLFLPLGLFLQPRLAWASGLIDVANVDEILLVCRRNPRQTSLMSAGDGGRESTRAPERDKDDQTKSRRASERKYIKADRMEAKMNPVDTKATHRSDIPETGMHKKIQILGKPPIHRVPARVLSEPTDGLLRFHPLRAQGYRKWHFTIDVDWVPGSQVGLEGLLDFCDRWKMKATIFVAGRFAKDYPDLVGECRRRGHELGTHGWEHGGLEQDEDFRSASYEQQRAWIRSATEAVEKAAGVRPVVFRAPSLWIGETTLRALEEEGYRYDSSIPARRFDCGIGRVHYLKYFRAPTEPYRLSSSHLRLPGHSSIIELAPSAFLFPINMATLRVLGLPMMKWMLRRIIRRASRLVFYCHPYEFVQAHRQSFPRNMSKWNMKGMTPENLPLLDGFVEHVMLQGYAPTLFADSFEASKGTRPLTRGTTRFRPESIDGLSAHAAIDRG